MQITNAGMQLRWDDVRLFLALCRARTLGEAAGELGVDVSTVSRRLSVLEEVVGASLFQRGRGGISATPATADLLPVAEEIERAMGRFSGAAESLEQEVSGTVRVACPPDLAEVVLVPALPSLRERYPGLHLELIVGEGLVEVARREADLAVRTVKPTTGDLLVRTLAKVEWMPAAAPSLVAELGTLRRWEDAPWIGFGERLAGIPAAQWLQSRATPSIRTDSIRVQVAVVQTGVAAAVLPSASASFYGLANLKTAAPLRRDLASAPRDKLFLVTPRALRSVPRVRAVWEFLLTEISQHLR